MLAKEDSIHINYKIQEALLNQYILFLLRADNRLAVHVGTQFLESTTGLPYVETPITEYSRYIRDFLEMHPMGLP